MCSLGWGWGGPFALGMLGGYALSNSMYDPYDRYYAPRMIPPAEQITLVPSSSSSVIDGDKDNMVTRYDPAIHYEERKKFFLRGHGPDPDVIFHIIQYADESVCGVPGPCCPVGTSQHVYIHSGHLPRELYDIYSADEYLSLVERINNVNKQYQTHDCPFFCLWLCCIPLCIRASRETALKQIFDEENKKLSNEGVYWEFNWNEDDTYVNQYRHEMYLLASRGYELVAHLKVNETVRQEYEMNHPQKRKLYKQPYGLPLSSAVSSNSALPVHQSSCH